MWHVLFLCTMHKSTYDILFKFFTSRLEPATDETEREIILSTLSHLVAWKDDKSTHILCRDNYFCDVLLKDFEKFMKQQNQDGWTYLHFLPSIFSKHPVSELNINACFVHLSKYTACPACEYLPFNANRYRITSTRMAKTDFMTVDLLILSYQTN